MALVQTGGSPATWGHLHSNLKQSFDAQALKLQASRARVQVADEALKALRSQLVSLDEAICQAEEQARVSSDHIGVLRAQSQALKSTNLGNSEHERRTLTQRKEQRQEYVARLREQSAVVYQAWRSGRRQPHEQALLDDVLDLFAYVGDLESPEVEHDHDHV